MARMPGAVWRPLPGTSTTRLSGHDILCWHTMVGSLDGTDNYFRTSAAGTNSHFGVGYDGTIYQWVDTAYRSGANLNGNYHIVSVETADVGTGFPKWNTNDGGAVPAWTDAQIEACARIAAWVNQTHNIPLDPIPDAKLGRRGNGYHRQGVPGYMVAGAEKWSNATGKVCPGDRRIAQLPQLLARARAIVGGADTANTNTIPVEEDMPITDAEFDIGALRTCLILAKSDHADAKAARAMISSLVLEATRGHTDYAVATLQGEIRGLRTALESVAAAPTAPVDLAAVFKAAQDGARSVTDNLRVVPATDTAAK